MHDSEWDKKSVKISQSGLTVYLPPLEDIVLMKLIAGRSKDMTDLKHILSTGRDKIDKERLLEKAKNAGFEKKIVSLLKRIELLTVPKE
ncbi:MAG: DUF6036 family nucleotidyltransferase [Nitrososphaerales archaeon]